MNLFADLDRQMGLAAGAAIGVEARMTAQIRRW
jgi:hypothetical protein